MNKRDRKRADRIAEQGGWLDRVRSDRDRLAVLNGCWFDEAAGRRVDRFFWRVLRHSKGDWAGERFELSDWQREDVVMPLYGWKKPDGSRRFDRAYIEVPKKNGKSTLSAGLSLYHLIGDRESGAEVFTAAADRGQASIVYNEAVSMVKRSPHLKKHLDPSPSIKRIVFEQTLSFLQVLTADAFRNEGLNISALIFDELHAQPNRRLWDALRYGGAVRRQPLTLAITTAGANREGNVAWQQHEYAQKLDEGIFEDDGFFSYIRGADDDDDWADPATWRKANPSLGITISMKSFERDFTEAKNSREMEAAFRRYRLNQWERSAGRWLEMPDWDACNEEVDPAGLIGRECWAGLDLASTQDVTSCVLLFPDSDGGYTVLPYFWLPERTAQERGQRDGIPYRRWASEGNLALTDGDWCDYNVVERDILGLHERYPIRSLLFDPKEASMLAQKLIDGGVTAEPFIQSFSRYNEPTKFFEQLVSERKLRHGGHPVLRWMASNVSLDRNIAQLRMPSKSKSSEKIDGIVASVMALAGAMTTEGDGPSVYETRGVLSV